jgi:hypothetical protein
MLSDGVVFLKPFKTKEDRDYLFRLAVSDDKVMTYEHCFKYAQDCWAGETKDGIRGGVVYLSYVPEFDWWVLNAYRDDRVLAKLDRRDWSFRAADLIINHFFLCEKYKNYDRLYTTNEITKRKITSFKKKLGFIEAGELLTTHGTHIVLVKVREI